MSDYTVVWSGELERKGLTFSLIGDRRYTGNLTDHAPSAKHGARDFPTQKEARGGGIGRSGTAWRMNTVKAPLPACSYCARPVRTAGVKTCGKCRAKRRLNRAA
jgi:hypothetical protein